jgi:tripartite-type tricarboxylate transporter receptor subunit TctC
MLTRRALMAGSAAVALATPAAAQAFPNRSITLIVPYPPGGPIDTLARLIAQEATTDLGRTIVVENRPGGSGIIGSQAVARAEPDGHTLVLGTNQTHATNQSLIKNCPYDALRDFTPVAGVAAMPHVLVVGQNIKSFTALTMSSAGDLDTVVITSAANGVEMMRCVTPALAHTSCCRARSYMSWYDTAGSPR